MELQGILFIPQTHECMQHLLHIVGVVLSPWKSYKLVTSVAPQKNTTICVLEPKWNWSVSQNFFFHIPITIIHTLEHFFGCSFYFLLWLFKKSVLLMPNTEWILHFLALSSLFLTFLFLLSLYVYVCIDLISEELKNAQSCTKDFKQQILDLRGIKQHAIIASRSALECCFLLT